MSISLPNGTLLATPAQQTVYTAAVTRILHLSNFPAELKTRDLQVMFKDYENDKGGFRIKWVDDTNALVVFADAGVAKRAYLSHLLSPPPSFPPPAKIAPYTKPDAAQIIQSLAARAMGHRSSMSNYSQQVPLGALPVNVNVNAGGTALAGLDGLPNGMNGTSLPGQGQGSGLGQGQHIRAGSMNKGLGGAGWTFPSAAPNRANSGSNGGGGSGSSSMGPPPLPGTGTGTGIGGRHGRTGSASFSRSAMGSIGGGGGSGSGALSFGTGSGGGAGTGAGTGIGIGGLPTHAESLDSPAIPAGFSTTRLEGVGGGSSRRLTGRYAGAGGAAGAGIGGGAFSFGGGNSSSTNNRAAGTSATTTTVTVTGTGIAERPDSRRSVRSVRSGDSSDTEPIVVVQEPRINSLSASSGSTIDGRGKVPFGQWKMPSSASASASGSTSASPTPTGSGSGHGHGLSPAPDAVGLGVAGAGARRDSVSADKALREVEKALRGVEAQ